MNNRLIEDVFISNFFIAKNGILENRISKKKSRNLRKWSNQPKVY